MGPTGFGPIVDAAWLAANLDSVVVVDVRWSVAEGPGRAAHAAGHIPGAVFADLDVDLSAPASVADGRHPLPTPAAFAASMGALGIGDTTRVVAYDDAGGVVAARLWWMLDAIGRPAAVLDGGFRSWTGPVSSGPVAPAPAMFTPVDWPTDRLASPDDVEAAIGTGVVVLDARSAERFAHGSAIDPRPGHVPGAKSAPATDNLDEGSWRTAPDLRRAYEDLDADGDVIVYCGSGVTACADLLGRRRAGLGDGRLFVGSWSQWGADPDRRAEVGPG